MAIDEAYEKKDAPFSKIVNSLVFQRLQVVKLNSKEKPSVYLCRGCCKSISLSNKAKHIRRCKGLKTEKRKREIEHEKLVDELLPKRSPHQIENTTDPTKIDIFSVPVSQVSLKAMSL